MGFVTTVVVSNDSVDLIENDPEFGKKLLRAVREVQRGKPVTVAGSHAHVVVLESHHMDQVVPVLVGAQNFEVLDDCQTRWGHDHDRVQLDIARNIAAKHGYRLVKQPKKVT